MKIRDKHTLHNGSDKQPTCAGNPVKPRQTGDLSPDGKDCPIGHKLVNSIAQRVTQRLVHMAQPLILASGSEIRAQLLAQAGLEFTVSPARVDEDSIIRAMQAEEISPDQIADALADAKASRASARAPGALVIGADQVLALGPAILQKPSSPEDAQAQLRDLSGQTHHLFSAAVIYLDGEPQWRHTGHVRLTMHDLSDAFIDDYVDRNWNDIRHSVGGYQIEAEGIRLFSRIEGDYFHVLGLAFLELLNYLRIRGVIAT